MRFRIVPLSADHAAKIRSTRKDDFGNEVVGQVATGYGPCRVSLKPFVRGQDRRLLLSHSPFEVNNAFNQPGPIFIHENEVDEYSDVHRFPPGIKSDKENFPLSLIGYSSDQRMVFSQLVGNADVDIMISQIFDDHPEIGYLHARNSEACCFICRVDRERG